MDGVDIRDLNIFWLRSQLGLISQEPVLFNMTIAENIAYGKDDISSEEIIDAAKKAKIHQFIKQLPLVSKESDTRYLFSFMHFIRVMTPMWAWAEVICRVVKSNELPLLVLLFVDPKC